MKKTAMFLIMLSLFIVPFIAMAQENKDDMKCGPMCKSMMMRPMMGKSMVASNDGGVIILAGNQLFKYDKDLNLVKTAELKIDMGGMQKRMQEMGEKCPEMKQKMQGMMNMRTGAATSGEKTTTGTKQASEPQAK